MTASTLTKSKRSRLKSKRSRPSAAVESPQSSLAHVPCVEAPDRGETLGEGPEDSLVRCAEAPDAGLALE